MYHILHLTNYETILCLLIKNLISWAQMYLYKNYSPVFQTTNYCSVIPNVVTNNLYIRPFVFFLPLYQTFPIVLAHHLDEMNVSTNKSKRNKEMNCETLIQCFTFLKAFSWPWHCFGLHSPSDILFLSLPCSSALASLNSLVTMYETWGNSIQKNFVRIMPRN